MSELEISIKRGVPTPETCKELDWKEETYWYWIDCADYGGIDLYHIKQIEDLTKWGIDFTEIAPAPQMHEIMAKIPNILRYEYRDYYLTIQKNAVSYYAPTSSQTLYIKYKSESCLSEALSQIYIKLRKGDLL